MSDVEVGRAKRARVAYSFDDVSLVPSRRTRDPQLVSLGWKIDAYNFAHPIIQPSRIRLSIQACTVPFNHFRISTTGKTLVYRESTHQSYG